jgi:hypothetical protein
MVDQPDPTALTPKYIPMHSHNYFTLIYLPRERREDRIFHNLLHLCHGLEDRLADATPEDLETIADQVRH